jgi:16S rRNA (guanine966-N2)-methyltransferase
MKKLLKLTGGSFAGRKLYVPERGVRPATNRVREAIFSTLYSYFDDGVKGLLVLDLFAGTGSLGLEALSRGAAGVTFVDSRAESVKAIQRNLEILGFAARIVRDDVSRFLRRQTEISCDLVFIDPPYAYRGCGKLMELLQGGIASGSSVVVVYERAYSGALPAFGEKAVLLKRRKYGQTELLYYRI